MNIIDKLMAWQFATHTRDSFLHLLFGKYNWFSLNWFRQRWYRLLLYSSSNKGLFTLIHDKKLWDEKESLSGPGSTFQATKNIRTALSELVKKYGIRSMLDIPCGDFNWMKFVNLSGVNYIGADIVEELIRQNTNKFASDHISFSVLDVVRDTLPEADLIICRDGLVHLNDREVIKALKNIRNSNAKYLLMTNFPDHKKNQKPGPDYWRPINFRLPPFNLPEPVLLIDENEKLEQYSDKSMCLWEVKYL
jgi:hypothetical protein